jgi:hypothetical protein
MNDNNLCQEENDDTKGLLERSDYSFPNDPASQLSRIAGTRRNDLPRLQRIIVKEGEASCHR